MTAGPDQNKADNTNILETPALRKREKKAKLETTHHPHWLSSTLLWSKQLSRKLPNTPLLSTLVTSDWLHACKSNTPTTIKHWTFFHLLIPYQHILYNPVIWTFYLFVFNTIVKIFTCLRVLCFCNCVFVLSLQPYTDITLQNFWLALE